ncbi:BglG family transcription antiterminator [Streptococcus pluranimalium]|uniref:BglG family transcription antiterminator n=1 Tax=Streptococcus pluranimalium TaxID=82348 RepID=UPI0039FC323D
MVYFEQRILKIIQLLLLEESYVTANELSIKLGVSKRTIQNAIQQYNRENKDLTIHSVARNGYYLDKESREHIRSFIEREENILAQPEFSIEDQVLGMLLTKNDWVSYDNIIERIYVSESTIRRCVKQLRPLLNQYQLEIVSKQGKGLRVDGTELKKRLCFTQRFLKNSSLAIENFIKLFLSDDIDTSAIRKIVLQVCQKYNFLLTETGIDNLVIHVIVSVWRVKNSFSVQWLESSMQDLQALQISKEILGRVGELYNLHFPDEEGYYLSLHLQSKQLLLKQDGIQVDHQIEEIIQGIHSAIKERLQLDFFADFDLFTNLAIHMQPMVKRVTYGIGLPNPVLKDIKITVPQAWECAVIAADIIGQSFQKYVSEDEIGYLALHYSLALERLSRQYTTGKLLIVCNSGKGTAELLKQRIAKKFNLSLNNIDVVDYDTAITIDGSIYNHVISTVQQPLSVKPKVIYIDNLFSDISLDNPVQKESLSQLLDSRLLFLNKELSSKEDVLAYMTKEIENCYPTLLNLKELVMQRERLASTEIGNLVAVPHPNQLVSEKSMISICTLKKTIEWDKQKVKYIFLVMYGKTQIEDSFWVNPILFNKITNIEWLSKLDKVKTVDELICLFEQED